MDAWGWEQLRSWLAARVESGSGRCLASSTARGANGRGRARASRPPPAARRPSGCSPPVRAAPAAPRAPVELAPEGVPLNIIQRQLGHANSAPPRSSPRDRRRRDHRHRARQARTDDARHRRTAALIDRSPKSGSTADAPAGRSPPATLRGPMRAPRGVDGAAPRAQTSSAASVSGSGDWDACFPTAVGAPVMSENCPCRTCASV